MFGQLGELCGLLPEKRAIAKGIETAMLRKALGDEIRLWKSRIDPLPGPVVARR